MRRVHRRGNTLIIPQKLPKLNQWNSNLIPLTGEHKLHFGHRIPTTGRQTNKHVVAYFHC